MESRCGEIGKDLWRVAFEQWVRRVEWPRRLAQVSYMRSFEHLSCPEIAAELSISVRTVKAYDRDARARLGVANVREMTQRLHELVAAEVVELVRNEASHKSRLRLGSGSF